MRGPLISPFEHSPWPPARYSAMTDNRGKGCREFPGRDLESRGAPAGFPHPASPRLRSWRRSSLQPPFEPGEGLGLHGPVELMRAGIERAAVSIAGPGLGVNVCEHAVSAVHLRGREEL